MYIKLIINNNRQNIYFNLRSQKSEYPKRLIKTDQNSFFLISKKKGIKPTSGGGIPDTGHSNTTNLSTTVLGLYTTLDSSIDGGTAKKYM